MNETNNTLSRNSLAFIAMANEYCHIIESPFDYEKNEFLGKMLLLLPRLYISAADIDNGQADGNYYVESYLEEETYNSVKESIAQLLEPDDVYLEVFLEDMKYSDTPLSANISENLADIYQVMYNVVAGAKDVSTDVINEILADCKVNFQEYWGQTLCNVLRAIHSLKYNDENKYN